jgi:hypothetical protein
MKYQIKVIISFLIILFLVGYLFYNKDRNKSIKKSLNSNSIIKEIKLRNDSFFYLKTKVWGVSGNHTEIILSEKSSDTYSKEQDIVFYTDIIFYKVSLNQDTLIIYVDASSISTSKRNFSNKIKIIELKEFDEINYYRKNYKELNLVKYSVYDSHPCSP